MSIAKPEQSARGFRRAITKILVSSAIAVGCFVGGAATASADPDAFGNDPDAFGADPNPFSGFSCTCRETAPPGSLALSEEINRGIREDHSAWLAGLPAPTQPM
jgi:hypothetical protein